VSCSSYRKGKKKKRKKEKRGIKCKESFCELFNEYRTKASHLQGRKFWKVLCLLLSALIFLSLKKMSNK